MGTDRGGGWILECASQPVLYMGWVEAGVLCEEKSHLSGEGRERQDRLASRESASSAEEKHELFAVLLFLKFIKMQEQRTFQQ